MMAKIKLVIERVKTIVRLIVLRSSLTTGLAFIAWGCATPIGVNYVDRSVVYRSLTANVLSAEKPSSFSGTRDQRP
jgi:hypothetical protein